MALCHGLPGGPQTGLARGHGGSAVLHRGKQLVKLVGLAVIAVEGFEVEVELAKMLGLEAGGLEFNGDEAVQSAMEEKQVKGEVLPANLDGIFGTDEAEIAAQFGEKAAQIAEQRAVQVGFGMVVGEAQKLQELVLSCIN